MAKATKSAKSTKAGRPRKWAQDMVARFPPGTFERIKQVIEQNEDRTDFVRAAVERELRRRYGRL